MSADIGPYRSLQFILLESFELECEALPAILPAARALPQPAMAHGLLCLPCPALPCCSTIDQPRLFPFPVTCLSPALTTLLALHHNSEALPWTATLFRHTQIASHWLVMHGPGLPCPALINLATTFNKLRLGVPALASLVFLRPVLLRPVLPCPAGALHHAVRCCLL